MSRVVRWSALALDELDRIGDYISQDDPDAADAMLDRIEATAEKLGIIATGHPGRVNGIYEKLVPRSRYIIAYELADYGATKPSSFFA